MTERFSNYSESDRVQVGCESTPPNTRSGRERAARPGTGTRLAPGVGVQGNGANRIKPSVMEHHFLGREQEQAGREPDTKSVRQALQKKFRTISISGCEMSNKCGIFGVVGNHYEVTNNIRIAIQVTRCITSDE